MNCDFGRHSKLSNCYGNLSTSLFMSMGVIRCNPFVQLHKLNIIELKSRFWNLLSFVDESNLCYVLGSNLLIRTKISVTKHLLSYFINHCYIILFRIRIWSRKQTFFLLFVSKNLSSLVTPRIYDRIQNTNTVPSVGKRREKCEITDCSWKEKMQPNFLWALGPETVQLVIKSEHRTEADKTKIDELFKLSTRDYRPNTKKSRRDFLGQNNYIQKYRQTTGRLRLNLKNCDIFYFSTEILISKLIISISIKLSDKFRRNKYLDVPKTVEHI